MSFKSFYLLLVIFLGFMSCESKKYAEDSDILKFELNGNIKSFAEYTYITDSTFNQVEIPEFHQLIKNKGTLLKKLKELGIDFLDYTAFNRSGQIIELIDFSNDIDQNIIEKYTYDNSGNKIKSTISNFDENIFRQKKLKYDKNNNIVEKFEYGRASNFEFRRAYFYNENNFLTEEKHYDKDDELFLQYFYKYNSNDKIIEITNKSSKIIFLYDDNTNLTERISYDINGNIDKHLKLEYDSLNNIIKEYHLDTWLEINKFKAFKYDSNRNVIEAYLYDGENNLISKQISKYTASKKLYKQTMYLSKDNPNPRKMTSEIFNERGHVIETFKIYELDSQLDTTQNIINYTYDKKKNIRKIEHSLSYGVVFREIEYF